MDSFPLLRAFLAYAGAKLLRHRVPLAVGWDLTHRCNRRCLYCGFNRLPQGETSTSQALALIDQMARAGTVLVHLSGGEPMVRNDIGPIVDRLVAHGIECALNTNGYRIPDRIDEIKKIAVIRLSFDGPEDVHEELRGPGSFSDMRNALEAAQSHGIRVVLNSTIHALNVQRIPELLSFAEEHRTPIKFQPVNRALAYGKNVDSLLPDPGLLLDAVRHLREQRRRNRLIVNSPANLDYYSAPSPVPDLPCVAGLLYARINSGGVLYPCSMKMDPGCMRSALQRGFLGAFLDLPKVHCGNCICPPTLELNLLFSLNIRSIWSLRRYL